MRQEGPGLAVFSGECPEKAPTYMVFLREDPEKALTYIGFYREGPEKAPTYMGFYREGFDVGKLLSMKAQAKSLLERSLCVGGPILGLQIH